MSSKKKNKLVEQLIRENYWLSDVLGFFKHLKVRQKFDELRESKEK